MRVVSLLLCAVLMVIALAAAGAEQRVIAPPGPKPIGPYSPGILAGDFLYVSGQGGRDAAGTLPGTIEGQTRGTLQNVKAIVEAAGLTNTTWRKSIPAAASVCFMLSSASCT